MVPIRLLNRTATVLKEWSDRNACGCKRFDQTTGLPFCCLVSIRPRHWIWMR